jgi:flagellar protein FlaG
MAQDVISSAILIIAAVIATVVLVNALYPSLYMVTGSVASASDTSSDRLLTDVKIVMASAEGSGTLHVWVKNDGSTKVPGSRIAYTDVYFGDRGHMSKASANVSGALRWTYVLDDLNGDGNWGPGETLQITVTDESGTGFTAGDHQVKLVLYNSASIEDTIGL